MGSPSQRGMDWPTAWAGLVPVYGFAILVDVVFPLFAVPIWAIFLMYALKTLDGARMVRDPWQGRSTPRRLLLPIVVGIAVEDLGLVTLSAPSASGLVTALLGALVGLGAAAWFVAGSAPPGVRDQHGWLRLGMAAALLNAFALPATLAGPLSGLSDAAAILVIKLVLAGSSLAGFLLASREGARRGPVVARKLPRG